MSTSDRGAMRVAFQGEPGAFSEAAAIQLLGEWITTIPCPTFDAAFSAVPEGAADALLAPVEAAAIQRGLFGSARGTTCRGE